MTRPGTCVTAASRCTFFSPPDFAPLRSLPSTATARRAGTCPGSPHTAGSSHGWAGCGRNQPSWRSSRKDAAAGGFCFLFFRRSRSCACCSARCAAYAAGMPGSSAIPATAAEIAASNSSGSSRNFPSRSSIDADGATRCPVRGLTRQPCAARTSWPQPAAASAACSGPQYPPAAAPAATDTRDTSSCRFPRSFRVSVSRPSSDSRNGTGSNAVPAGRWRRRLSVSQDEDPGAVKAVLVTVRWCGNPNHHPQPPGRGPFPASRRSNLSAPALTHSD